MSESSNNILPKITFTPNKEYDYCCLNGNRFVKFDNNIQDALKKHPFVIGHMSFDDTWYLFSRDWKVALSTTEMLDKSSIFYPSPRTNFLGACYIFILMFSGQYDVITNGGIKFNNMVDSKNNWICQEVLLKKF